MVKYLKTCLKCFTTPNVFTLIELFFKQNLVIVTHLGLQALVVMIKLVSVIVMKMLLVSIVINVLVNITISLIVQVSTF